MVHAEEIANKLSIGFDKIKADEIYRRNIEKAVTYVDRKINESENIIGEIRRYNKFEKVAQQKLEDRLNSLSSGVEELIPAINHLEDEKIELSLLKQVFASQDKIYQLRNIKKKSSVDIKRFAKNIVTFGLFGLLSFAGGYYISNHQSEEKINHYEQIIGKRNQQDFEAHVGDSLKD